MAAKWPKTVWEGPKWSRRAKTSGTLSAVYARVYGPHVPGAKCQVPGSWCRVVSVRGLGRNGLEGPNSFMWCGGARGKVPNIEKCFGRALLA